MVMMKILFILCNWFAKLDISNVGGGFRTGHSTMYMPVFIKWLNVLKEKHGLDAMIMSVEYGKCFDSHVNRYYPSYLLFYSYTIGLAPAHKYPGPVLECVQAYKHLTEDLRVPAWKVIFSGDSAGGALCLETLVRTYAPGLAENFDAQRTNYNIDLPAGMVLISPLVTPETTSGSWQTNDKYDMVGQQLAKLVFKEYLDYPNVDPDQLPILRIAQIQSGFSRFAPKNALVFVGEKEVMRDDIMNLIDVAERDGHVKVRTCKENYAHDWYLIREIVKQKDKPMLDMYDEVFADFAAYAVAEAATDKEKRRKSKMISMHVEPTKDLQAEINDAASKSATASDKDETETPTTPIPGDNSKPDEAPSTNTNVPTPVPASAEANTIVI